MPFCKINPSIHFVQDPFCATWLQLSGAGIHELIPLK
jgi:hypothetical protein